MYFEVVQLYEKEVEFINSAAELQEEIKLLQAQGVDTSRLEGERQKILNYAREIFNQAVSMENYARHGSTESQE